MLEDGQIERREEIVNRRRIHRPGEVVSLFDRVGQSEVCAGSRHPRGRADRPVVGIFAQRAKNRQNRIGVTVCRLASVEDLFTVVEGLDAMREFGPIDEVRQPPWTTGLLEKCGRLMHCEVKR